MRPVLALAPSPVSVQPLQLSTRAIGSPSHAEGPVQTIAPPGTRPLSGRSAPIARHRLPIVALTLM